MSLYPILWAAEHAPVKDAEERAVLVALVMKCDFDGCNAFRSYPTLAKAAVISRRTVMRRCHDMEQRGLLRRQTQHQSAVWLRIPEDQRPVCWEVMIPAEWWSAVQLAEINEQRAGLGRPALTPATRPALPEAPPKKERADKGSKRPKRAKNAKAATAPDDDSAAQDQDPADPDPVTCSHHPPVTTSHPPRDYKTPPPCLVVTQPSESPSESPSEKDAVVDAGGTGASGLGEGRSGADGVAQGAGGFARAGASSAAAAESGAGGPGGSAASSTIDHQDQNHDQGDGAGRRGDAPQVPAARRSATRSPRPKTVKTAPRRRPAGYDDVAAALPPEVVASTGSICPQLTRAICDVLSGAYPRTPAQAIARLNRTWYGQNAPERCAPGYQAPADAAPGQEPIRRPGTWLAAALITQDCPRPECEDGELLTTGKTCELCQERARDAAEARAAAQQLAWELGPTEEEIEESSLRAMWNLEMCHDEAQERARVRSLLTRQGLHGDLFDYHYERLMAEWFVARHRYGTPADA
ncbi:hypothetical protein [Streptomyces chumphonensis]|uniref:hypothetical protein n=1 Tax=Streptomyces chumphonensis TaxID=1214925 RepID=UPI003D74DE97